MNRFAEYTALTTNMNRCINKIKKAEMKKFGLKGTQVNCFFALSDREDGVTAKEIVATCCEDKASVSRALKTMAEKGFVRYREETEGKKYGVPLVLTEKGKEIAAYIDEKIDEYTSYRDGSVTEEELAAFYQTFRKIYRNIKTICENYEGEK